jgi:small subunit ribosomal protein S9
MNKTFQVSGRRKQAVSRATIRAGKGKITVNNKPIELFKPETAKLKLMEPLIIAENIVNQVDIEVKVQGGGANGQVEAARLVIAKALVQFTKDDKLKRKFIEYDRHLLVADLRIKETTNPNDSRARAARQKSYR